MFPLIYLVGKGRNVYAVIYDKFNLVLITDQPSFGLYTILIGHDVDNVKVTDEVKKEAAQEWRRRYPNGIGIVDSLWEATAEEYAKKLLAS